MAEKFSYAALGLLTGVAISGGLGVILFALTANPVYIALSGAGAGIGLVLGAGIDWARQQAKDA